MPFRSEAQRRFMFAKHPAIAHKWAHGLHSSGKPISKKQLPKGPLPEHVQKAAKRRLKRKKKS